MKKNIIILFSLLFSIGLFAENKMEEANTLYTSEKYEDAVNMYENILIEGEESAALYYNLGNAYYKLNKMGPAILNYERSLLLDPNNKDTQFNLALANGRIVDKIDKVENPFFLRKWINSLSNIMSSNAWAIFSIITFILFIIAVFVYVFGRYRLLKKISFFLGCLFFVFSLASFFFAKQQHDRYVKKEYAIIIEGSVTVKGSPDESGTDLFVVHEGTKVKIRNVFGLNEWYEIQLEDGNPGWVKANTIEKI